jgi:hypothetical protein
MLKVSVRMSLGLMETVCDEKIVISAETKSPFDERIAARKTIVYETLVDAAVIKIAGENLKDKLFAKYGFLKPKPEEVSIVSVDKYYEPYVMVGGKYSIDYYRKRVWTIKVADDVSEVTLGLDKLKPKQVTDSSGKVYRGIELEGEERVKNEVKASFALDASGRDVSVRRLPSAPSERNPEEVLAKSCTREVPADLDLSVLRTRIFKRPSEVSWIVNELFEVNERVVIYAPRFRVVFKNVKTGKEKVAEFCGVTGKLIQKVDTRVTQASV